MDLCLDVQKCHWQWCQVHLLLCIKCKRICTQCNACFLLCLHAYVCDNKETAHFLFLENNIYIKYSNIESLLSRASP